MFLFLNPNPDVTNAPNKPGSAYNLPQQPLYETSQFNDRIRVSILIFAFVALFFFLKLPLVQFIVFNFSITCTKINCSWQRQQCNYSI